MNGAFRRAIPYQNVRGKGARELYHGIKQFNPCLRPLIAKRLNAIGVRTTLTPQPHAKICKSMKNTLIDAHSATPEMVIETSKLKIPAKLILNVQRIPAAQGHLMIALYNSEDNFMVTPIFRKKIASIAEKMTVDFDLHLGEYSVMLFHDQNGDGILNRNSFGIPTEPWTTSSRIGRTKGKPSWAQTRFEITELSTELVIKF